MRGVPTWPGQHMAKEPMAHDHSEVRQPCLGHGCTTVFSKSRSHVVQLLGKGKVLQSCKEAEGPYVPWCAMMVLNLCGQEPASLLGQSVRHSFCEWSSTTSQELMYGCQHSPPSPGAGQWAWGQYHT